MTTIYDYSPTRALLIEMESGEKDGRTIGRGMASTETGKRLLDLEMRTAENSRGKYETTKEVLGDIRDNLLRPVAHLTWKTAKLIGRGIKRGATGLVKGAVKAIDIYADAKQYADAELKIRPDLVTERTNLENRTAQAEEEYRRARADYKEFKSTGKSGVRDPTLEYGYRQNVRDRKENLRKAQTKTSGFFKRYLVDIPSNAVRWRQYRNIADKLTSAGLETNPAQVFALFSGYPDKYNDLKKPKKDKVFCEVPLFNFKGEPIKERQADGTEKDRTVKFETFEDYARYAVNLANMVLAFEELGIRREQARTNPFAGFGAGMGFPPGFNPGYGFNPFAYGPWAPQGAGYNPGQAQPNPNNRTP